ncbi:MAG TPA: TetR family transcriptional regulator [Acidimicrobiales bacterium]
MPKVATRVDADAVLAALMDRSADTEDVDRRILDAAGRMLVDVGLEDLEVDRVAELAGVGRSTVYRRFDGRNALLAATVAHEAQRLLGALADAVAGIDEPREQLVAAFCAGLRLARATGLAERIRDEPLLLRLLTVDGGPVLAAASDQLATAAQDLDPTVDDRAARETAELLVRLAISLVLTPQSALDLDDGCEDTIRRHLAPLLPR